MVLRFSKWRSYDRRSLFPFTFYEDITQVEFLQYYGIPGRAVCAPTEPIEF